MHTAGPSQRSQARLFALLLIYQLLYLESHPAFKLRPLLLSYCCWQRLASWKISMGERVTSSCLGLWWRCSLGELEVTSNGSWWCECPGTTRAATTASLPSAGVLWELRGCVRWDAQVFPGYVCTALFLSIFSFSLSHPSTPTIFFLKEKKSIITSKHPLPAKPHKTIVFFLLLVHS